MSIIRRFYLSHTNNNLIPVYHFEFILLLVVSLYSSYIILIYHDQLTDICSRVEAVTSPVVPTIARWLSREWKWNITAGVLPSSIKVAESNFPINIPLGAPPPQNILYPSVSTPSLPLSLALAALIYILPLVGRGKEEREGHWWFMYEKMKIHETRIKYQGCGTGADDISYPWSGWPLLYFNLFSIFFKRNSLYTDVFRDTLYSAFYYYITSYGFPPPPVIPYRIDGYCVYQERVE